MRDDWEVIEELSLDVIEMSLEIDLSGLPEEEQSAILIKAAKGYCQYIDDFLGDARSEIFAEAVLKTTGLPSLDKLKRDGTLVGKEKA